MKKLLLVFTLVVFAVPATAIAKGPGGEHKNAARYCKALRAQVGADAFRSTFGGRRGKSSFGRCVSTQRKARRDARKRARKACRAQGLRGRAMKRCFREQLAADPAPTTAEYTEAVEECRAEQAEEPDEFAAEFGTGPDAFAKCVAHELADDEDADEPGDDGDADEPADDPADEPAGEPGPEEL